MPKGTNNMKKHYDGKFIIMQAAIESNKQEMRPNKQDSDEKMTQFTVKFETMLAIISSQLNTLVSSPTQKYTSDPPDPTTMVPDNSSTPQLDRGHSTKICGMWTLIHKIGSPKFYEVLINTELKGETDLDLKNFYNHIKMCLNEVNIL